MDIETIKGKNLPIIIYGSGIVGEVLLNACNYFGIRVECSCDDNKNKENLVIKGKRILHTSTLYSTYKNALFIISAADINDIIEKLNNRGYNDYCSCDSLLHNYDIFKNIYSTEIDFVEYAVSTCLLCHSNYLDKNKLFFRSIDIIITEKCSLKCMHCSNLMQYYKNPKNIDTYEILKSIDLICNVSDEINEFRVLGGEPFMKKDMHLIIQKLVNETKVKKVVIYTNGTIAPNQDQISAFKSKKIIFIITDYGSLSKNIDTLYYILVKNNISFHSQKAVGWTYCSNIERRTRSIEENTKLFKNCCAKNTFTLSNNKLYRCPFSANTDRLSAPEFPNDKINIASNEDTEIIKNKIKDFMLSKNYLETCDFCNGRTFGDIEITPAVQIKNPLKYTTYE